jgi:hypothetical protein
MKLSENPDIPSLSGWVNITEAAERLGITRQHSYKLASQGGFKTLHRVGNQPAFVISTKEIDEMLTKKREAAEAKKTAEVEE